MPWFPISGALRELRLTHKLDVPQLAKLSGLREQTIRLHESEKAPLTMQSDTVRRLAKALGCPLEALAKWDLNGDAGPADRSPREPPLTRLGEQVLQERKLGAPTAISFGATTYERLTTSLLRRCLTACSLLQDRRLAIIGHVEDYEPLSVSAARTLDAEPHVGGRFLFASPVAERVMLYPTVFTRSLEHSKHLIERADDRREATVIARILVALPRDGWSGFVFFEPQPQPRPFAFVVEDIACYPTGGADPALMS